MIPVRAEQQTLLIPDAEKEYTVVAEWWEFTYSKW